MKTLKEIWEEAKNKNNIFLATHDNIIPPSGATFIQYQLLNYLGGNTYLLLCIQMYNSKPRLKFTNKIAIKQGDEKFRRFDAHDWRDIEN